MITDTIAAIATPPGSGGIGIIRISGSRAVEVVSQIFSKASSIESHKVVHGYIFDSNSLDSIKSTDNVKSTLFNGSIVNGSIIDEVLVIPMLAPRSYTAEDVVEIHAHSGSIVMKTILELILSKGVRLAEPGEFTKRAFLNGRIDLTQAEAVADIINANSSIALKMAVSQGLGNLRKTITNARDELISLLAKIEVSIDFPEEGGDLLSKDEIVETLRSTLNICQKAIQRYQDAHFLKDGLKIAICGPPNVGKSSLMNRLLERERSIVTQFPGTTRDLIEESLNINGIPFIISDTAGIQETNDPVEKIGIEKAKENIVESDMVLFVEDLSDIVLPKDFESIRKRVEGTVPVDKKTIIVLNKIDKLDKEKLDKNKLNEYDINSLPDKICTIPVIPISAKCNIGIDILRKKITEAAASNLNTANPNISSLSSVVPNIRHKTALKKASQTLKPALDNLMINNRGNLSLTGSFEGFGEETLSIDIRNAVDSLGEITGDTAGVDILDNIFSKFCIGK